MIEGCMLSVACMLCDEASKLHATSELGTTLALARKYQVVLRNLSISIMGVLQAGNGAHI